jgi:hypothetical protein
MLARSCAGRAALGSARARWATPTVTFVLTERRKCRDGRDYRCIVLQVVEGGDLLDHVSAFEWLEMRFGESRPLCRAIA